MPERFRLNCQGIAKPTQGKSSNVVLIPRFDGFIEVDEAALHRQPKHVLGPDRRGDGEGDND